MPRETTTLRPAAWLYAVFGAGELISTLAAVLMYLDQGASWPTIALAGLAIGFSVGTVHLALSRIDLMPGELRVTGLLGGRAVAKADVTSAKVEGGAVCLQLQNGQWFKLPRTGQNSLGVLDSVQVWLGAR